MVESFLANRCYYQQIILEQEKDFSFDSLVVAKVMEYSLCKNGKDLVDQLQPIASVLDRCQSDGSLLMQMYAMPGWASCTPPPRESCQQAIRRCHHARAPHMLHPKYRGEKLTMEQQQDVSTWLASRDPGFITSFTSFQAKAAPFPRSYFSTEGISISPHTWWQGATVCGVDTAFADLIQRLTTSPAFSASIEMVGFSTFSFIHNKSLLLMNNDGRFKFLGAQSLVQWCVAGSIPAGVMLFAAFCGVGPRTDNITSIN